MFSIQYVNPKKNSIGSDGDESGGDTTIDKNDDTPVKKKTNTKRSVHVSSGSKVSQYNGRKRKLSKLSRSKGNTSSTKIPSQTLKKKKNKFPQYYSKKEVVEYVTTQTKLLQTFFNKQMKDYKNQKKEKYKNRTNFLLNEQNQKFRQLKDYNNQRKFTGRKKRL